MGERDGEGVGEEVGEGEGEVVGVGGVGVGDLEEVGAAAGRPPSDQDCLPLDNLTVQSFL